MKKLLTVLIALSLVAGGFAADPVADVNMVDIGGSASTTFGFDLDNEKTGFKNDADVTLTLNLLPSDLSASTAGTGVWGELVVLLDGDMKFEADDVSGTPMTLTNDGVIIDVATIHVGDLYFGLTSGDFDYGGDFNYPNAMGYDNGDTLIGMDGGIYYMEDSPAQEFGYNQGFTAGYGNDMFSIEAAVRTKANISVAPGDITSIQVVEFVSAGDNYSVPEGSATVEYVDQAGNVVSGTLVNVDATIYRVTFEANENSNYWTDDYALGLSAMVTPMDDLMIQAAIAYGVSGEKENDLSMFAGASYKMPIGMFSLMPVATWNLYTNVDTEIETQNAIGLGINFGWGEEMDGDSVLYGFYDTSLAYVGADEGDGTIMPGISLFTSLNLLDGAMDSALPIMVMVHTGDIIPNLSAQVLFSSNIAKDAKTNAYLGGQNSAAAAMTNASSKLATQIGVAADYDIMVGDLTITPSAGVLVGITASESGSNTTSGTSIMPRFETNVAGLVDNTTFTLGWGNAAFASGKASINGSDTKAETEKLGEITLKAEIAL